MSNHSNVQKYAVVVTSPDGKIWIVGTETQRGFTEKGVFTAQARLEAHLPHGWSSWEQEITPLSSALASNRK